MLLGQRGQREGTGMCREGWRGRAQPWWDGGDSRLLSLSLSQYVPLFYPTSAIS